MTNTLNQAHFKHSNACMKATNILPVFFCSLYIGNGTSIKLVQTKMQLGLLTRRISALSKHERH